MVQQGRVVALLLFCLPPPDFFFFGLGFWKGGKKFSRARRVGSGGVCGVLGGEFSESHIQQVSGSDL